MDFQSIMRLLSINILVQILVNQANCYHVMFVHEIGTKSHLLQIFPLVESLLSKGHEVTGLFYSSSKIKHENYTEILVPNVLEEITSEFSKITMQKGGQGMFNLDVWKYTIKVWQNAVNDYTMLAYDTKEVQAMIKQKKKVDVIIGFNWFFLYLPEVFDCPFISFSPSGPTPQLLTGTGNEINLSIQPLVSARYIEPMTLSQRIGNTLYNQMTDMMFRVLGYLGQQAREKALGHKTPNFIDIVR